MTEPYDWRPFLGDRYTPEKVGDEVKGIVTAIRTDRDNKDQDIPVVTIRQQGRGIEVWATQTLLKIALAEKGPQVGDGLHIRLSELRHTGQKSPLKVFSILHKTAATIEAERAARQPASPPDPPADDEPDVGPARTLASVPGAHAQPETDTWEDVTDRLRQLPKPRQTAVTQFAESAAIEWDEGDVPAELLQELERHERQNQSRAAS